MEPDEELRCLQAFLRGDSQAVDILVEQYYPALLNFLLRMGCQPGDTGDIIQDTFIKAVRGIHNYKNEGNFRAWLFKICQNNLRDHYKKAANRREVLYDPNTLNVADYSCPDELIEEREQAIRVQTALNRLPPRQRLVVVLRYYHGFSVREIAHLVGCPDGTVKSRLNTALNNLKNIMEEGKSYE